MAQRKTRGILKLTLFSTKVKFYTEKEIKEFESLNDFFLFENSNGLIVFLVDKEFSLVYDLLEKKQSFKPILIHQNKEIGFQFGIKKNSKTFYSLKYKVGTDEFDFNKEDEIRAAIQLVELAPANQVSGYTGLLRKIIKSEEQFRSIHVLYQPSLSPMIFAKCGREFENVKCRDACSFYPYLLTQELPHFKGYIKKEEIDLTDKTKTYYGGLRIYNIKAKTLFYSISLVGSNNDEEIAPEQGININHIGTRLISADKVIIFGWLPFLLKELQDYDFDYIEMTDMVAEYELKIDQLLREVVIENFEKKQSKKRKGESYKAEKVMLNRYYGYFITKGNTSAPAHYGQYIVAKGKTIIRRLALEIGLKDVVQGHTDSIKFVGDHQDVIDRYNSEIEFEELGKFADEGTMEKVIYYNTNRAKYLINGKLGLKHGGIAAEDLEEIIKKDYNEISFRTEYQKTIRYTYDEEFGFYPLVKNKIFGGSL